MARLVLPRLPGLDEYESNPPVLDKSRQRFRPEIERFRPEAEERFSTPEEVDSYLEEQDRQSPPEYSRATIPAREQQRQARIYSQRVQEEEAAREAERAEITSPITLGRRATRAVLRPVQKVAGDIGAEVGRGIGVGLETTFRGVQPPSLPRGQAQPPPSRTKLPQYGEQVGRFVGETAIPGSAEELGIELAAGPVAKGAYRAGRVGARVGRREIRAAISELDTRRVFKALASERGSIGGQSENLDDLLNEVESMSLEDKLALSLRLHKQSPESAAELSSKLAERQVTRQQAEGKQSKSFFREQGHLRKRAGRLSQLFDDFKAGVIEGTEKGETGQIGFNLNPERLDPGLAGDVARLEANLKKRLAAGASVTDIREELEEYAVKYQELHGKSIIGVPSQEVPPSQLALGGEGQPAITEGIPAAGTQPPKLTSAQRVALAKVGREDLIPPQEPMTPREAALLKGRRTQMRNRRESRMFLEGPGEKPPDMTEEEYGRALAAVRANPNDPILDREHFPPDWDIDRINRFRRLQSGISGPPGGQPPEPPIGPKTPQQPGFGGEFEIPTTSSAMDILQEIGKSIADIPGISVALRTTLSPPLLRQGRINTITRPRAAMREFKTSIDALLNDETAAKINNAIQSSPWIRKTEGAAFNGGYTWEDVGGHILQIGETAEEREVSGTLLRNSWLGRKVRGSRAIKGFDRQAVVQLNLGRTGAYSEVAKNMWEAGNRNIDDYVDLRKLIEHSSQRGPAGPFAKLPFFFSPRAMTGRALYLWDLMRLIPKGIATGDILKPGPSQLAAKQLTALVGSNMALLYGLQELGAGRVEYKDGLPTLRSGNFHLDPWAGWNVPAKFVLGVGKDINNLYGDKLEEGGWESLPLDFASIIADRGLRAVSGGLSPVYTTGMAEITGKKFTGEVYNLEKEISSGGLFTDWTLPFPLEDIAKAFKVDVTREGVLPEVSADLSTKNIARVAATAPASVLSEGVSTYDTLTDLRNDLARAKGVDSYNAAKPELRYEIERSPEIEEFKTKHPTPYREAVRKAEESNEDIQEAKKAEERFIKTGQLDKPIREYWQAENDARRTIANDLKREFKSEFEDFDEDKYDKAIEAYYNIKERDEFDNPDFDATEKARQDWFEKQPPDVKEWIDQSLLVTRKRKTPLHREYLGFIDEKESLGYFKKDEKGKPIPVKAREELDRQNPRIDVQGWKFGSGLKSGVAPALQSVEAVNQALALSNVLPNRPVKFANVSRPINENEGSLAAWKDQGQSLSYYHYAGSDELKNSIARTMFGGTEYGNLTDDNKKKVRDRIQDRLLENPKLQAQRVWWGEAKRPTSIESVRELRLLIAKYGPLMEK